MNKKEVVGNLLQLSEEQLSCKNPANENYVRQAYIYSMASGIENKDDKKLIEGVIYIFKIREEECTKEEFEELIRGIGNQAVLSNLWDYCERLNKGTVDEAIMNLINELRLMRQSLLQSNNVNFFLRPKGEKPLQSDEWLMFKIDWFENELSYFKELKALGKVRYFDIFQNTSEVSIKLTFEKSRAEEAIRLIYEVLNEHLIKGTFKEFKRLFGSAGRQKLKKIEWLGSQAEIKAMFDLLRYNGIIKNQNLNQLAECCFFSTRHSIIARTLGAVTSQSTYILLTKEQNESHVLYELITRLNALKE